MYVRLGAAVLGSDGEEVGKVNRLVIDRKTLQIIEVTAKKGWLLTKDRIVTREMASDVDAEGRIHLKMTSKEAEQLGEYFVTDYVPQNHQSDFSWSQAVGTPIGGPRTTITDYSTRYDNLPENIVVVEKDMDVNSRDGEKLGELQDIVFGENAIVTGLTVGSGRHNAELRSFSVDQVAGVGNDYVRLKLTLDEARAVEPTQT